MTDTAANPLENATPAPTLTLTPVLDDAPTPAVAAQPVQAIAQQQPAQNQLDDSMLSAEEKQMVDSFAQQIDVRDSGLVLQYGAGAQKKMADFSETALANVRTQDLGEVGGRSAG